MERISELKVIRSAMLRKTRGVRAGGGSIMGCRAASWTGWRWRFPRPSIGAGIGNGRQTKTWSPTLANSVTEIFPRRTCHSRAEHEGCQRFQLLFREPAPGWRHYIMISYDQESDDEDAAENPHPTHSGAVYMFSERLSRNDIGMTWSGWAAGANRDSSGLQHTRRDRDVDPDHPTTA